MLIEVCACASLWKGIFRFTGHLHQCFCVSGWFCKYCVFMAALRVDFLSQFWQIFFVKNTNFCKEFFKIFSIKVLFKFFEDCFSKNLTFLEFLSLFLDDFWKIVSCASWLSSVCANWLQLYVVFWVFGKWEGWLLCPTSCWKVCRGSMEKLYYLEAEEAHNFRVSVSWFDCSAGNDL